MNKCVLHLTTSVMIILASLILFPPGSLAATITNNDTKGIDVTPENTAPVPQAKTRQITGNNIDVEEGECADVTQCNIAEYTLGSDNYLNNKGEIRAKECTCTFEGVNAPVAVAVDAATGTVLFKNAGTVNAVNENGNACGIYNRAPGVTIQVEDNATGTITAIGSKTAGTSDTYTQGIGGTYRDGTSKLISNCFNIIISSTSNGNETAIAKGLRIGVAEINNLTGNIEAQATSQNNKSRVTALDCRTTGTFGTISGNISAKATTHNAVVTPSTSYTSSFGIYALKEINIGTLDASSTITSHAMSDTQNSTDRATSYNNLYAYGIETWSGDINIGHLNGKLDILGKSATSATAAAKGINARNGDLTITDLTGTVRTVTDTIFSEGSESATYALMAYTNSHAPTKGNVTLNSSGTIEAIAPRSSNAFAIYAGAVGKVTLKDGSQTTGQVFLVGENSELTVKNGATITNHGNCEESLTVGTNVNGRVVNEGKIKVTGKNTAGVYLGSHDASLFNSGTIEADGATNTAVIITQGEATHTGSIVTTNGAKACMVDYQGMLTLSGSGENTISGEVVSAGDIYISSGDWKLSELNGQGYSVVWVNNRTRAKDKSRLTIEKLSLQGSSLIAGSNAYRMTQVPSKVVPPPIEELSSPENAHGVNIVSFDTPNTIDGHLRAGRNSIISLGTSNFGEAITAVKETNLWGANGVTSAVYLAKPYSLTDNASLTIGRELIYDVSRGQRPSINFAANSLLSVNMNNIPHGKAILSSPTATLKVNPDAYLQLTGATPETFKLTEFSSGSTGVWSPKKILLQNVLLDPKVSSSSGVNTLTIKQTSSTEVFGAKGSTAALLDNYTRAGMSGIQTTASERFMGTLLTSTKSHAPLNVEKAANLAGFGGVAHTAFDIADTSRNLTSQRIPASGSSLLYLAQYTKEHQFDIYVTPIYQYSRTDSMKAGNFTNSFSTNIYGLAIGAEAANAEWLLGAAVNFGKADTDGSSTSSDCDTDNDYVSILGYGAYILPEAIQLKGEFIYVTLDSDIKGNGLSADVDGDIYAVGLECSRPFEYKNVLVTPYAGIDYAYYDQTNYHSKTPRGKIFKVGSSDMSTWLLPLGFTVTKKFEMEAGWRFNTHIDLGTTFAFGDTDITTKGRLSGSSFTGGIPLTTDVCDPVTGNLQLGVAVEKGHFTFALDLNGNLSEHRTYRGATLKCAITF